MFLFRTDFKKPAIVLLFLLLFQLIHTCPVRAEHYDIAYYWDTNIDNVLDYKDKLENVFPPEISRKLIIVGRENQYGVIYDENGSALHSAQVFVRQNVLLHQAGLHQCYSLKDKGYYRLYNISYGVGPHLKALEKKYSLVYSTLGKDVGKDLFIEQLDENSYALLYLRRGDIRSTYKIARKHARILRRYHIKTAVIPEDNDTIVYGESSHLDTADSEVADSNTSKDKDTVVDSDHATQKPKQETAESDKKNEGTPIQISPTDKKQIFAQHQRVASPLLNINKDAEFDQSVENFIKGQRRRGKLNNDEITGWIVYDLNHNKTLVNINADRVFQAASMIKPFLALAYFHQVKAGKLRYTRKSRRIMERMIQRSSNSAANWVMHQIGGPAECERILKTYYGYIFKKTEIREYIPANGRTYKNTAIPSDYIRFLHELWKKRLPYYAELRRLMALPGRDRLYEGTPIPHGTLVYDKTGTTAHLCGDMGILVPRDRRGRLYPYAVVGIIERQSRPSDYGSWMITRGNIIRKVSTLVYNKIKKQHNLL
jgi:beta-lactamase class A